ncbi:PulJ/GspJ family protein [Deinococcus cellulosilyticus]|uniref:Uncharacterized protein n=1 Tax=Deinococcus cellulosilyticus (strain DSM 18568 / NBRC 106333 / KACC 11606 / 5516J-15) TaxID=1223518 RepID=A0A511N9D0_DEIC1|nr:type II secretion system protein [Deinococcus cellulosilyticus]GEM49126.1 hypothetical protein DC3_47610 [Deinococcus cellulosilyticus NBRC 106333 = KACC 11606]
MTRSQGFTLIETLITMLILGFIITMLISVQSTTMKFSTRQQGMSTQLTSLAEATGYISDMVRQAQEVKTSMTVNGQSCSISSTTNPCFGVLVPASQTGVTTNMYQINTYLMLVYRLESRSTLDAAFKTTDSWADSNTSVIREYRSVVCKDATGFTACNGTAPAAPNAISNAAVYLVADGVSLTTPSGAAYAPFSYTTSGSIKQFTLQVQMAYQSNNTTYHVPASGPQSVMVRLRN